MIGDGLVFSAAGPRDSLCGKAIYVLSGCGRYSILRLRDPSRPAKSDAWIFEAWRLPQKDSRGRTRVEDSVMLKSRLPNYAEALRVCEEDANAVAAA